MIADPTIIFENIRSIHLDGATFVTGYELRYSVHSGKLCPVRGSSFILRALGRANWARREVEQDQNHS